MTKSKSGLTLTDRKFRNAEIVRLRAELKMPYKDIAAELQISTGVVTAVLKSERSAGRMPVKADKVHPYTWIIDRAKVNGSRGGKLSDVCEIIGLEGTQWIWNNRTKGLSFSEMIGVIAKDYYLDSIDEE